MMENQLTMLISPTVIGAVLGLAMFNLSMAISHALVPSFIVLVLVSFAFPNFYVDRSPRCVYCFGKISLGAQFCPHCGRIQPESE